MEAKPGLEFATYRNYIAREKKCPYSLLSYSFACEYSVITALFVENTVLSPLCFLGILV